MSISVLTGASFNASADGFTTGLVGTIGVRILNASGATVVARTTSGITESAPAFYEATLTAPATAGSYTLYWDNAGSGTGLVEASEDLTVTASQTTGIDLCTLADVRAWLQKQGAETSQDAVIQAAITSASSAIMEFCDREFAPLSSSLTRRFGWNGSDAELSLAPYDLRAATSVILGPETTSPTTLTEGIDYELRPIGGREPTAGRAGTFTSIAFGPLVPAHAASLKRLVYMGTAYVDVVGDWGFPVVPTTVARACVVTAALWLRRDVSAFTATFNLDEGRLERPAALPSSVVGMLRPFCRGYFG